MAARQYRHEEVATAPRGWRVRTITQGVHMVRMAFPPGPQRRGAGKLVSILHPLRENPAVCVASWKKASNQISDRAHRYRAQQCVPPGPRRCAVCGSTRFLVVDHRDGDEWNDAPGNLRWLCKSCNTRLGAEMAKKGRGRRTRQYNQGAKSLGAYVAAAIKHKRGAHDAGGKIIHETPKAKRSEYARKIWAARRRFNPIYAPQGNPRPVVFYGPTAEARRAYAEIRKDGISGVLHAPSRGYQVLSVTGERDAGIAKNVLRRKGFETKLGHIPNPLLEAIVGGAAAGAAVVGSQVAIKKLQERKGKGMWPFRRSNQNNGTEAEQLYRSFHGRDPREVLTMSEALMAAGTYVALGEDPELWLHPVTGKDPDGWDQADITFDPSDEIKAAVDKSGAQLFFVGKNQRLPGEFLDVLAKEGADLRKRFLDVGEVYALSYQTEKKFDGFVTIAYSHKLGGNGGKRPRLVYDQENRKLLFVGGVYSIAPYDSKLEASPGIVN